MHELADQFLSHLNATWRYRWYAIVFAWIIALGGWIAVYLMPERYEASARVYVDTQSVLRPLLAGLTVQPNVDQMVTMMGRTLINRPNLEKVIRMADLDLGLKTNDDREQLIVRLTRELSIQSGGRENLYTIAFVDKNAQEAKRVVQALLTLFMEGTQGDQQKDSAEARRFIDEQLQIYNDKLVAAESAVTEFKRQHMGFMAGDRRDYYTRLVEAESALSQATLELKEAQDSRDAIKKQLADGEAIPSLLEEGNTSVDTEVHLEIDPRIQALEQKLDGLRLSYTELHPDIVATVRIIDQLKAQRKAEEEQKKAQMKAEAKLKKPSTSAIQAQDPVYQQLTVALASADAAVAALKARVAEYGKRYAELRAAANSVPQIDAEFTQLTRDYEVTKKNYENLLGRRESAQISGDMEMKASVMDFRVIDPPQVSSLPKTPNRSLLMSLVLVAALGGGLGVAFLISQIRPTFENERRLREVSGLPVLGTVVMALTDAQKTRRTRGLVAVLMSIASLLSAYAAIIAMLVLTVSRV